MTTVTSDAVALVTRFLDACADGDLDTAESLCTPDAVFEFPYGSFTSLRERLGVASGHYRHARKHIAGWDVSESGDHQVVTAHGTLYGEDNDGVPFSDIRFIDRFELVGGRVRRQQVWNDLAYAGIIRPEALR